MNALVIYDSKFGNTEQIARAIAAQLRTPRLILAGSEVAREFLERPVDFDLLIIGGPTQIHGASPAMRDLMRSMPRGMLEGMPAAVFDTRYQMSELLTGSAAGWIAGRLKRTGARLVVPPESFFVARNEQPKGEKREHAAEQLEPGELERAEEWARSILAVVAPVVSLDLSDQTMESHA